MSLMITEIDLEPSLGEMVEAFEEEMVEEDSRIEMLEVIMGKEVLEVIEVEIKVNGMEEVQVIKEIMVKEEMVAVKEEMVGVEEEMVGETILETSQMVETLEIGSRNR